VDKAKIDRIEEKIRNGFIIIDKPLNLNSHEISAYIGKWLNTKAGHAGTLDPNVSGLLIIGLGKATRMLRFLTEQDKEYVCLMKLKKEKSKEEIENMFNVYKREIWQMPPEKSAVAKKVRKRKIYDLILLEQKKDLVLFKAIVEKGTYMRVLCNQLNGEMLDLRRTSTAGIKEEYAITMQKLKRAIEKYKKGNEEDLYNILKSPEEIFSMSDIQKIYIKKSAAENIMHGAPLYKAGVIKMPDLKDGYAAVFCEDKLIAIMRVEKNMKNNIIARIERLNT